MFTLDLLITNARIVDVFRLRLFDGWVGVKDGRFLYVEEGNPPDGLQATERLDLAGRLLAPGLVDSHMHIESSITTPRRFAEGAVPYGTTTILADPHEVANVAGEEGVRWMIRASENLPLRVFYAIPSCVPATSPEMEWTAPVFDAAIITRLAQEPSVIALGEVMDYRGVLAGSPRLKGLVEAAHAAGLFVEGHIPTLAGPDLSEYLSWRVTSDHTLTTPAKINEQISKGLAVMIQTKTCTPELMATVNALPERSHLLLITDDIEPPVLVHGHLSGIMRLAIEAGLPPLEAWASATIRPARYIGRRDIGGVAPGHHADFCVLDGLESFPPHAVYFAGQPVARQGRMLPVVLPDLPPLLGGYAAPGPFTPADFRLVVGHDELTGVCANAVHLVNETTTVTHLAQIPVQVSQGYAQFSEGDNLALVAVVARDRSSQSVGVIHNLGWDNGAYAASFAHDSHNLLVAGRDATEMALAANLVYEMGGGIALVRDGQPIATMRLPVFGLISDAPLPEIVRDMVAIDDSLRDLGVRSQRPFLIMSLLSLSVSPHVKFTDKGVIDTEQRRLLPPWELKRNLFTS